MPNPILFDLEIELVDIVEKLNKKYTTKKFRSEDKYFGFIVYETDRKTEKESTTMQMRLKRVDGAADDLQVFPSVTSGYRKIIYNMIDKIIDKNNCSSSIDKAVIEFSPTPLYGKPIFTSPIKVK